MRTAHGKKEIVLRDAVFPRNVRFGGERYALFFERRTTNEWEKRRAIGRFLFTAEQKWTAKRSISVISTNYPLCIAEAARLQFGQAVRRETNQTCQLRNYIHRAGEENCREAVSVRV